MCVTCGCGDSHDHHHDHGDGQDHGHDHGHHHTHSHAPGLAPARMLRIEQDILAKNDRYAGENRAFFARGGVLALNLLSSPGSGRPRCSCAPSRR